MSLELGVESKREGTTNKPVHEEGKGNTLPSYTAMIAQAILSQATQKTTLSEIYEFMERRFPPLKEKGNGWRNCVRHTLSLSDCFIKLHRPENGRSCHWAVHPSYLPRFIRGDYRKRRQSRSRRNLPNGQQEQYGYPPAVYDRQSCYSNSNNRMIPIHGSSDMMDASRHYPSCSPMVPTYNHLPTAHAYHQDTPSMYQSPYGQRDYQSCSYHPYFQTHSAHYP